tara:strand:+ start:1133 stop:2203 length:1071 start_codon:yes stop_codon:yes gene_type:complete
MPTQPEDFEWATEDLSEVKDINEDGVPVVLLNKNIPNAELQNSGIKYKETWPRQYLNYMFNLTFRWIKYLNNRVEQVSGKNLLINGSFDIWQRGTSLGGITGGVNKYVADRWAVFENYGSSSLLCTKGIDNGKPFLSLVHEVVPAAQGRITLAQTLENDSALRLEGKTLTATFDYELIGASMTAITINAEYSTVGGAVVPSNPVIASSNNTTGTGRRTTSLTFTVPSAATLTSTGTFGVRIYAIGTSEQIGDGIRVYNVKLEEGEYTTNFEQRSVGEELALCQRYYERYLTQYSQDPSSIAMIPFKVEKRAVPAITKTFLGGSNDAVFSYVQKEGFRSLKTAGGVEDYSWTADAEI